MKPENIIAERFEKVRVLREDDGSEYVLVVDHLREGRPLKVLRLFSKVPFSNEEVLRSFNNDFNVATTIKNKNISEFYELITSNGMPGYLMSYTEGTPFSDFLRNDGKEPLAEERILSLVNQLITIRTSIPR